MRVLFWSELFWPHIGGGELFGVSFLSAMRERGYEFSVVTRHEPLNLPKEDKYKGIPIYRFPFRRVLTGDDIKPFMEIRHQLTRLKQTFKPDLIHINGVSSSAFFHLQTANSYPTPTLVRMNQEILSDDGAWHNSLMRKVLCNSDWISCVSATLLDQVRCLVPETTHRSSIIYTGLNAPLPSPEPLPIAAPRLLCLGRLIPQKGFDLALSALASLVDHFPHVRLIIAGDGPDRPKLEQQARELGLSQVVEFVGWVEPNRVLALMNTTTMVLIPSRFEGLPQVAIQAALMARPVVATCVGSLPEVVVPQETGLLVEKENSVALAKAIAYLLDHPERTMRMGQAAHLRAQEMFRWKRCIEAYDALYRELGKRDAYVSAM